MQSSSRDILRLYGFNCGYEAGRFDPSDYAGNRVVVMPGDPEPSQLVQTMREGHHAPGLPGQELALVIR